MSRRGRLLSTSVIFVCSLMVFWVEPYSCDDDVPSCTIPGGGAAAAATQDRKGRCVTPDQCPELLSLEFEPNLSFKKYLKERSCGPDENGNPRVCCDPTAATTPRKGKHYNPRKNNGFCLSFRFEPGRCVPIETCPSIHNCSIELRHNYNPTLHLHLTQSFCYQEGGRIFVCCDDNLLPEQTGGGPALKPVKKLGWQRCQTPFLDAGKCVSPARCGLIEDGDAVPEEYRAFMVGCDQPNGVQHMCCPGKEIRYDEQFGKQCKTVPGGRSGNCVEPDRCDDYVKATDKQGYVRENWCYTSLEQVDYVCCAKKKILNVPEKAISIGNRAGEDAPTCITPNTAPGRCVALAECAPIVKILRDASASKIPVSPAQATFLRNSVCNPGGTQSSAYYVCCDEVSLQTVTTPTPTTAPTVRTTVDASNDITDHPNLRLLDRTTCGRGNLDDKIAFGEQAPMYQYPWMAMLIYRSSATGQEGPECGGTIINNRYVLTAAHCIDGQMERLSYVRLGEYDTRTDPDCDEYMDCAPPVQRYNVEESRIHPNFTRIVRSGNDIGLLRVDRPIVFSSDDVAPICLPFTNTLVRFDPSLFWITGWGLTERLDNSPILLQTRIPSVACSLSTHSICAGFGNGTLHCRGDSGGPMKVQVPEFNFRYVQYGIISAGPGCGVGGAPGVSTRVAFFMRWILDNIRE